MTDLHDRTAATGDDDRSRPRAVLPALCATQITSWGVVYYAFPVLNPAITEDTGWSAPATTAAWLLAGIAMAATFYQPAFAAVTRWWGPDRVRALTIVTLAGGPASTVFAPLTAVLAEHLSWRTTYVVLAAILAVVTIPAHALALRTPWPLAPSPPSGQAAHGSGDALVNVARSRPFLLLAAALTASAFTMYAVVIALVPLLTTRGASTTAAAWAPAPTASGSDTTGGIRWPGYGVRS
ncbi:MFS transporter [Microbispora hainanensis]|uniref:MFS transporter n=1 Tax=Microbispora hainanensis TaxID=568844 RepID=UPI0033DF4C03